MREFLFPSKVYWEERGKTYGRLVVEPLERGFGTTIGNSLRRTLLSSVYGCSVVAVKIYGIYHEFSPIDGVKEDALEIIANIKQLRFKMSSGEVELLYINKKGEGIVTASDISLPPSVEVVNPSQKLFTITDPQKEVHIEIKLQRGFGYVPVEEFETISETGWIMLDGDFSPVRNVTFRVEKTRIEKRSDYDKLILELTTDGSKTPEEAIKEAVETLSANINALRNISFELPIFEEVITSDEFMEKLSLPVEELDISQRALNALKRMSINTIGDLVKLTEDDLKTTKSVGRKAINEIREALRQHGLHLGMDVESRR
ncbi:MAG: DNA-directed RNA polymerase subunit alpha [Aquificaceae bacterium]